MIWSSKQEMLESAGVESLNEYQTTMPDGSFVAWWDGETLTWITAREKTRNGYPIVKRAEHRTETEDDS